MSESDELSDRLKQIQDRLSKITLGQWLFHEGFHDGTFEIYVEEPTATNHEQFWDKRVGVTGWDMPLPTSEVSRALADANFITHAAADIRFLLSELSKRHTIPNDE